MACQPFPDIPAGQPFVMTGGGGGALGDLPAHAPRLSTVREAKMKTNNFLIRGTPVSDSTQKNLRRGHADSLVLKSHTVS